MAKMNFQHIKNHSNMLIYCSRNILVIINVENANSAVQFSLLTSCLLACITRILAVDLYL